MIIEIDTKLEIPRVGRKGEIIYDCCQWTNWTFTNQILKIKNQIYILTV